MSLPSTTVDVLAAYTAAKAAYEESQAKLAESVKHAEGYARQVAKRTPVVAEKKAAFEAAEAALKAALAPAPATVPAKKSA